PAWESVELESAVVRTGDATKSISKQELNMMDADWVGSAPRYPAEKILVASLPGLQLGSIVEYRVKHTLKDRAFFAMRSSFRSANPMDELHVRLSVPKELAVKITRTGGLEKKDAPGITETATTSGTAKVIEWTARNMQPIKPEDSTPPLWSFVPTVSASSGNWQAYATQVSAALQKASHGQPLTKKLTKTVLKDAQAKTDTQKVRAIRNFVAENIRPVGPSLNELPLTAITPADKTLEDGYGNSADRAVLLGAMLNDAGLDFHFTLASWSDLDSAKPSENLARITIENPMVSSFQEVLPALSLNDKMLYLNDTDQYDALGATSHDNRVGLMLSGASRVGRAFGNKAGQIMQIKSEPELRDRGVTNYRIELDAQGNAVVNITQKFYGNAFGNQKKYYDELPPEERHRHFLEMAADISEGAAIQGEPVTKFDAYPGVVSLTVKADKYAVREADRLYLTLPGSLGNLFKLRSDQRANPLYWGGPNRQTITTDIVLPEEFRKIILAPENLEWNAPNNAGSIHIERHSKREKGGDTLSFVYETDLLPAVLAPTYYGELLEINRRLSHPASRTVMLGRELE
ncbi:TPA: hypothetical protein DDW35_12690, partial [Candidatus Sumerlaeota bacterium]|nr:hypothetical protein [Candidatus Sumerlaeota bacterium]